MSASTYLISVAGSAGGFEPLSTLLAILPRGFPAAVVVGLHGSSIALVNLLRRYSLLPVEWAQTGAVLECGHVYASPPGAHLVVNPDGRLTISESARVRCFRPSADWLFESAAASYGDRHVAVVLSGMLSDGASKLHTVKRHGGTVFVQNPDTCLHADMPRAAIATGFVDAVLGIAEIKEGLVRLLAKRDTLVDIARWENPFAEAS